MTGNIRSQRRSRAIRCVLAGAAIAIAGLPAMAQTLPPLSQNTFVNDSLRAAAIGDTIRRNCPSISARFFVALRKVRELERYARSLGYTDEQIQAFIRSPEDRARLQREARDYMLQNGVVEGEKETYCALGRAEIASKSLIGQLIWSWK